MARNNLDMLTDTATAFERVTGETPHTMMDMVTYQPNGIAKKHLKAPGPDMRFINKLKDLIHENMNWLHYVNSERVRKDVGHKLVAAGKKRTTAFDFRVNNMVSYRAVTGALL